MNSTAKYFIIRCRAEDSRSKSKTGLSSSYGSRMPPPLQSEYRLWFSNGEVREQIYKNLYIVYWYWLSWSSSAVNLKIFCFSTELQLPWQNMDVDSGTDNFETFPLFASVRIMILDSAEAPLWTPQSSAFSPKAAIASQTQPLSSHPSNLPKYFSPGRHSLQCCPKGAQESSVSSVEPVQYIVLCCYNKKHGFWVLL